MSGKLRFYHWISNVKWLPKSYLLKFLLIAFFGVHLPLICIIVYTALSMGTWSDALPVLLVGLFATLAGTAFTIYLQTKLLAPVLLTSESLEKYAVERTLPDLPKNFKDEAGLLMSNAQLCVTNLDNLLTMKNHFLSVISHDTRNPLAVISLASEMIDQQIQKDQLNVTEVKKLTAAIQQASAQQIQIMNDILSLAQIDAGKFSAKGSSIFMDDLVSKIFAANKIIADRKGITFTAKNNFIPETTVYIDEQKTLQILNNIIHNAIKFTEKGGTVVFVAEEKQTQIEFTVLDNGIGMDEDLIANLFQPFSASQRAGTSKEKGSGLGLWISKTFTDIQGGNLTVKSSKGKGTEFHVIIPRRIKESEIQVSLKSVR